MGSTRHIESVAFGCFTDSSRSAASVYQRLQFVQHSGMFVPQVLRFPGSSSRFERKRASSPASGLSPRGVPSIELAVLHQLPVAAPHRELPAGRPEDGVMRATVRPPWPAGSASKPSSVRSAGGDAPAALAMVGSRSRWLPDFAAHLALGDHARPVHDHGHVHAAIERAELVAAERRVVAGGGRLAVQARRAPPGWRRYRR